MTSAPSLSWKVLRRSTHLVWPAYIFHSIWTGKAKLRIRTYSPGYLVQDTDAWANRALYEPGHISHECGKVYIRN